MTFEQQTPDRPSGQAVILHFTVFCVLLPLLQRFRGMSGIPGKLAFQFFQRGNLISGLRKRTGSTSISRP